ncbi:thiamine diphosphokinase [Marinitoga lauensis]|uniref:thiamine diphosphokinase n=1 Tax=Marinitoga lauensis TaxID=2201189 RepID=UPI001010B355|nr:thiamine diphosphokinase [Marinitoga lauensis]
MIKRKLLQQLKQKQLLTQKQIQALNIVQMPLNKLDNEINNFILENVFLKFEEENFSLYSLDYMDYLLETTTYKRSFLEEIKPIFLAIVPDELETIAETLFDYLDNNGILTISKKEFIKKYKLKKKDYDLLIETLKNLGPSGFAEESLEKALKIREKEGESGTPLSSLETNENIVYINSKPDIVFFKEDNNIKWEINTPKIPEIDEVYLKSLKSIKEKNLKKYIEKEMEKLYILKNAIKKRKEYLNKLAELMVKENKIFLETGTNPKRLGIRAVAKILDLSPSTVSRSVSSKYFVNLKKTILPFSSVFNTKESQKNEKEIIINFIKEHMEISDNKLSKLIEEKLNIKISRRTVNKYKNQLKRADTMQSFIMSGGEPKSSLKFYKNIIDNSDILIAVDKGIELFKKIDIEPDYLIGDLDSASQESIAWAESNGVEIIKYRPEKDFTDIDLAIDFAINKNSDNIIISGFLGDRLDHIFGALLLLKKYNTYIMFKEELLEISKISKNFDKKVKIGEIWSILSLTEKTEGIYLKGFKYSLKNGTLFFNNPIGISNETIEENIEISYNKGCLMYFRWKNGV